MIIIIGNGLDDPKSKNLDEAFCISNSADTFGKGMNPIILLSYNRYIVGQTVFFKVGMAKSRGEGNQLSHPACGRGVG